MNTNTDPVRALLDAAAAYLDGEYHDSDVEAHYNYQHRRRSERERLRAAINALASAPPSAPAGVEEMAGLLEQIRDLLASLPTDCLGIDTDASGQTYPIRDEVIHGIAKALAQQPAAPSGEAVAPAEDIIERLEAERDRCDNLAASTGNSLTREREARLANYFDCAVREIRRLAALAAQQQGGAK